MKSGERVYSLNENTGELVPSQILALLDMGIKPTYRLETLSGKQIETTANHPYLAKNQKTTSEEMVLGASTGARTGLVNPDSIIADAAPLSSVPVDNLHEAVEVGGVEPPRRGLTSPASQPATPTASPSYQSPIGGATWRYRSFYFDL